MSVSVPLPRPLPRRALSRLFTFRGRMSRSGFWASLLLDAAAFLLLYGALDAIAGSRSTLLLYPFLFWSLLAVSVQRYHDLNRGAGWLLLLAIPVVGVLWVAVELLFRRGTAGENRYGANPLTEGLEYQTNP